MDRTTHKITTNGARSESARKVRVTEPNTADTNSELASLGQRLRYERLKRNEPQAKFAARLGVSIPTLRKMEVGDSTVQIGHWASALGILNRNSDINLVLAPQEDLFAKFEKAKMPLRQRAPRSRR